MWALGDTPYAGIEPIDVLPMLKRGDRLGQPELMPNTHYEYIKSTCWREKEDDRPDFAQLRQYWTEVLESAADNYNYVISYSQVC